MDVLHLALNYDTYLYENASSPPLLEANSSACSPPAFPSFLQTIELHRNPPPPPSVRLPPEDLKRTKSWLCRRPCVGAAFQSTIIATRPAIDLQSIDLQSIWSLLRSRSPSTETSKGVVRNIGDGVVCWLLLYNVIRHQSITSP